MVNNLTCQAYSMKKASSSKSELHVDAESDGIKNVLIGIFVTILIAMCGTLACWVVYAYMNPNSASGIWLIEVI